MHHLESVLRGGHHERIVAQLVASIDVGTAFHDRLSDLQNWGGGYRGVGGLEGVGG